jgi:acetoin utilization deacetylase AcuC-like enzyme
VKTGLITSDTYQNHDTGPGHPEQIARVTVINENFKKLNNKNILWKKPSIISDEIIKNTHDTKYVDLVKKSFPSKVFLLLMGILLFHQEVRRLHSMQLVQLLQLLMVFKIKNLKMLLQVFVHQAIIVIKTRQLVSVF